MSKKDGLLVPTFMGKDEVIARFKDLLHIRRPPLAARFFDKELSLDGTTLVIHLPEDDPHFLNAIDRNDEALRKILTEAAGGDADYKIRHGTERRLKDLENRIAALEATEDRTKDSSARGDGQESVPLPFNVKLAPAVKARLDDLKTRIDAESDAEVIRRALSVYDKLTREEESGGGVIIRRSDGSPDVLLAVAR